MRTLFKTSYGFDIDHLVDPGERIRVGLLIAGALALPLVLSGYALSEMAMFLCYALAGLGLMVLTGFSGQVSFGHAAFLGLGAYAQVWFLQRGVPFLVALVLAGLIAGVMGAAVGRAASKMHGFYLAIATLAFAILVETVIGAAVPLTGGHMGVSVPPITLFGYEVQGGWQTYYLYLAVLLFFVWGVANLKRAPTGRAMVAVRDSETSAQSLGVNIARTKITAFFASAFITGVAGGLMAHQLYYLSPETFGLGESLKLLLMIVVGGLGTISGAIIGAVFVTFLPNAIEILRMVLPSGIAHQVGLEPFLFGAIIAGFIIFEPDGLYGRWRKFRLFLETYPYYKRATFTRQKRYLKTGRFR
ncbi:amino acid/amide ABC transporter membrane protein 2, HAAT family [Gemmobacter megaterium]|uniref:Amino acid/amide ABC transporter membrane protein 2, HAAT family n=1 Tax=Gemmobacter megaterium TaxID=1086013 RepID=A0A1N7N004_9RHOB|nr:branched-chain amino acid ABC transporter permease [Gemmobacter megaterium]GGE12129.1 branched-chain amino acid ABC transporter permease [Gemmobacter megaterium]SIS91665.1 amino acid/amide ABC transporter membrane protein 2, HAAT family [Gemmobacter megaterium]